MKLAYQCPPDMSSAGNPDPPTDLSYDNSVIIGDTVALQWSSPTYTGGGEVTVMEYRVTANDQTETVISSDEMVTYTSSGLIYGDVQVTAINSCGHESDSANVNISASGLLLLHHIHLLHTYITKGSSPFVYRDRVGWPASFPYIQKICISMQ